MLVRQLVNALKKHDDQHAEVRIGLVQNRCSLAFEISEEGGDDTPFSVDDEGNVYLLTGSETGYLPGEANPS